MTSTSEVDELAERVDELHEQLSRVTSQVTALAAARKPRSERAWWWPGLDKQQAVEAWETLAGWAAECLLPRFPKYARTLRPCWRRHADVVDELTALRVLWFDAYNNPQARPIAAAEYRGRWVPGAMERIEESFRTLGCAPNSRSTHGRDPDQPLPAWTPEQLSDFCTTDLDVRPEPADT